VLPVFEVLLGNSKSLAGLDGCWLSDRIYGRVVVVWFMLYLWHCEAIFCIINILEFEGLPSEEIFFDQRKFADDTDGRH